MLAAPGFAAEETYYRWQDAQGNVVMSDRPPADPAISFETIATRERTLRPAPPAQSAPDSASTGEQGAPPPLQQPDRMVVSKQAAPVTPDPAACEQARRNLEVLNSKPRIRVYDDQGELRYLTPAEMEAEREKSRLAIEAYCGG